VTSVGETLYVCADPGSVFVIEFVEVEIDGEPVALEHDEVRWVSRAETESLTLAPADSAMVRVLAS
jgi:hypothetical protein